VSEEAEGGVGGEGEEGGGDAAMVATPTPFLYCGAVVPVWNSFPNRMLDGV
jgi:hypothetical protein